MLLKETYSKKKHKRKRRKPLFDALLKFKNDESNLSLFGALNAKNIKKVKASIRNNNKDKENKKTKATGVCWKKWPTVSKVNQDDTFDRLFNSSVSSKEPKRSIEVDKKDTIKSYSNAKRMSLLDLQSPVFNSTYLQKCTGKRKAFHLTSTPISSPSLNLNDRSSKVIAEQTSVNQPPISSVPQLTTSFLYLSVELGSDKESASFDWLKRHPECKIQTSPDMFSSYAEYSINNSNKCLIRQECSNKLLNKVSFDLEPSVQMISDLSLNVSGTNRYSLRSSGHVLTENIFETCNLNMRKGEKKDLPKINITNTAVFPEHTQYIDSFDKICGLENNSKDKNSEANNSSKNKSSILSIHSTSRMKTLSFDSASSSNTSSGSDVSFAPALSFKINNLKAKKSKSNRKSTVKTRKQTAFNRRFYSAGSMEDVALTKSIRKIKPVDNIQGPTRKKCNSSNESLIILSSETSKSEADLENKACNNFEEDNVFDQSESNDEFNAKKALGYPKNQTKDFESSLSLTGNTRIATSKLSSHMLDTSLSCTELPFEEIKHVKNVKKKKNYSVRNKRKVSRRRKVYSEGNDPQKMIRVARNQRKCVSDNMSVEPATENLSFCKKSKRMSIARRQSHLVKEIGILKDSGSFNLCRTSYTRSSCSSKSTNIHDGLALSSTNLLDVVAEEEMENDYSPRKSIKCSSNLMESDYNAEYADSDSSSVLLCSTIDCDTREKSCNLANEIVSSARDCILNKCGQSYPLPFLEVFTDSYLEKCKKIGEGVYGEVFLCDHMDGRSTILKIIPIEGDVIVNGEKQKKYHEILTEVLIVSELSDLRYDSANNTDVFSEFINCWCVVGSYPDKLIQLWNEFSVENGTENDSPIIFDENQLFLVLELRNGGKPLESYVFNSAEQSSSALLQVAFGLAVAESSLEFEHRDLHWGNVLIAPTHSKTVACVLNGSKFVIPTKGVKATIIDFTLSRMLYKGCCIYNDLSLDPALFTASGDYQFDIYRLMRDKIRSEWINFEPYTNVLWLHYLLDKCLKSVYYHRKNTKIHKKYMNILKVWCNEVIKSNSAIHFVTNQNYC